MSKFMFFDFRCLSCGEVTEEFVKPDVLETTCPICDCPTTRKISTPTLALSGTDPDLPTAYDKWERVQRDKRKAEKDYHDRHGVDLTFGGDVKP